MSSFFKKPNEDTIPFQDSNKKPEEIVNSFVKLIKNLAIQYSAADSNLNNANPENNSTHPAWQTVKFYNPKTRELFKTIVVNILKNEQKRDYNFFTELLTLLENKFSFSSNLNFIILEFIVPLVITVKQELAKNNPTLNAAAEKSEPIDLVLEHKIQNTK